jgi:uncharacterized protein (TIGR02284 family)
MKSSEETIEILNDLVLINNDRITGYERARQELKGEDADLQLLFLKFIDQSRVNRNRLGTEIQALGGSMDSGTTVSGKIYRAWMDVKAVFTGHDRHTVLSNCEFGEDAAQKAYKEALKESLPAYLANIISEQQTSLRGSHDEIKSLRDLVEH